MNNTTLISQLKSEFAVRAKSPETLFLLKPADAIDFIDSGLAKGLSLAGVEGFLITEHGAYQPCQELSNDSADSDLTDERFRENTMRLIQEGEKRNVWFDVVFDAKKRHVD